MGGVVGGAAVLGGAVGAGGWVVGGRVVVGRVVVVDGCTTARGGTVACGSGDPPAMVDPFNSPSRPESSVSGESCTTSCTNDGDSPPAR